MRKLVEMALCESKLRMLGIYTKKNELICLAVFFSFILHHSYTATVGAVLLT
jgi:hypothetical protein